MEARFYDDAADFWAVTQDLYEADPVKHTTVLSVIHAVRSAPEFELAPPVFITVHDNDGALSSAVMRTPPWPLALSGVAVADIAFLVDELLPRYPDLSSVMGPREVAEPFAQAWAAGVKSDVHTVIDLRLHRLDELVLPDVKGQARVATEADVPVLTEHWFGFANESSSRKDTMAEAEVAVRRQLALESGYVIWEVDGVPVSSAAAKVPNAGVSRIGPVYTPPEHRRHGYAAAATAAAAQWAHQAGAREVLLYTDVANPTSNGVYRRIGFQPVSDYVELAFKPRT